MKAIIFLSCLLYLAYLPAQAQNKKVIDSLMHVCNNAKHDTTKILALVSLSSIYMTNQPDSCIKIAQKALQMSEKINFDKGKAKAWHNMGIGSYSKGKYAEAIFYYQSAFETFDKMQDKKGMAGSWNNMGLVYQDQGNYPLALEYYQKSLRIKEQLGDKRDIATSLSNMGLVYKEQGNYSLALEFQQKGLKLKEEIGGKQGIANSLNNIGAIYDMQGRYDLALEYYQKSLKIKEELGNKRGIETSLSNIGSVYFNQGNYSLASEYYQKSLKIAEDIGDKNGQTYPLTGLAQIAQKQKDYDKSIMYAQKSLQIAQEIKANAEIKEASKALFGTYKLKGNYDKALEYHELFKKMQDTIFNVEKSKVIANLEAVVEIERKAKEIEIFRKDVKLQQIEKEREKSRRLAIEKQAEAERLSALAENEKNKRKQDSLRLLARETQLESDKLKANELKLKAESQTRKVELQARELQLQKEKEAKEFQQYINYLVVMGLLSVAIFAYFIHRSRQKEKKAKEEVALQKEEIQQINEELQVTLTTVNQQKNVIEHKNKSIEDSIVYAQRIQKAILPLTERLTQHLPEYFILFQPRDVVSGDFYYFEEKQDKLILAVIDCTGHGVPGAFMTMIASEILNEIIQNKAIVEVNIILNELHKRVRIALKQKETQNRDGMDLVLLMIDKQVKEVHFAGAKNPLIYIQDNVLYQIKGDKMPIGGEQKEIERIFTKHIINIDKPTMFYMFTDGYQDQFGGQERKKFMISQMKEIFLEIHTKEMPTQKQILAQHINRWIEDGKEKQIDDILVMGVRL
jgi:tetratricopeptide (TPR) repeat protein